MLENSNRLRILCAVLNLSMDDFLRQLAARRGEPEGVLRESVVAWWKHRRQPKKHTESIVAVLEAAASAQNRNVDVAGVWDAPKTSAEFAAACGTSIFEIAHVTSEVCQREVFEQLDAVPYLRHMRRQHEKDPQRAKALAETLPGTYLVFRNHSSEEGVCREILTIPPQQSHFFLSATYLQYASGHRSRPIELSLFLTDEWVQGIGVYSEAAQGRSRNSMLHALVGSKSYQGTMFAGILMDVDDNDTEIAAQRVLIRKVSRRVGVHPSGAVIRKQLTPAYRWYTRFLSSDKADDPFQLTVNEARIARAQRSKASKA